jgi:hypothetical protein
MPANVLHFLQARERFSKRRRRFSKKPAETPTLSGIFRTQL